ncbi:AraC family transcriptional regulator [Sphingomonas flavalba]|mgnify:CR=1 FL=1|uniref:AraC family transcriptional regulator n=1 Tax=Sphingomonas flavalba TaxID=2559804 RepID=UPI001EEFC1FA|nr:AraC family transcriptional regulator [Sphingomonas flavalba]
MANEPVNSAFAWMPPELPLNRWAHFASNELDAVHQHMIDAFCPHDLTTEGGLPPIRFRHNQATLNSCTFNATDYGLSYGRVALFIPPSENAFLVQLALSGRAHFVHQGRSFALSPGYMSVLSPHEPIRQITETGCRHFTIKLDRTHLEGLLRQDVGQHRAALVFSPDPVPIAGHAASFMRFVRAMVDDMDEQDTGFMHPRTMASTEEMLGRLLLSAVLHNHSDDYLSDSGSTAVPYYVRRAEELIRERYADPLTLSDLIAAAGVSGRSLHLGFRRFRDDSPMGYLKRYRLRRARDMLNTARDSGLTVTDVALANGFPHLSKFSQDYARQYGELPSATLRFGRAG